MEKDILSGLNKHQARELLLRVKKYIDGDNLSTYNKTKVHEKQMEFHRSKARNKWLFGGNRSGKSVAGAVEAVWRARGIHPFLENKRTSGWVVSISNEVQRDVAQKEILYWLHKDWIEDIRVRAGRKDDPEHAIIDFIVVKNVFGTTSTIGFKSCDQGREKFQGTSQNWIWFDEEPPKEIHDECNMRIMDTKGDIWGTMTPLKGLTWVYYQIYKNTSDPNIKYWSMEWADNPFLDKDEIKRLESTMTESEKEARQYGKFVITAGLMFGELRESVHIKELGDIKHYWQRYISIDYGLDALAVIWWLIGDDGKLRIYRAHKEKDLIISEAAQKIIELTEDEIIQCTYAPTDLWNRRQETGRSAADIFNENGLALVKATNNRMDGWLNLKEWFKVTVRKDEQTGKEFNDTNLIISDLVDRELIQDFQALMKNPKKPGDALTEPHSITHYPDAVRCFTNTRWIIPKQKRMKAPIDHFSANKPKAGIFYDGDASSLLGGM